MKKDRFNLGEMEVRIDQGLPRPYIASLVLQAMRPFPARPVVLSVASLPDENLVGNGVIPFLLSPPSFFKCSFIN